MVEILKTKPYRFQKKATRKLSPLPGGGLFAGMGTGKTLMALKLVGEWFQSRSVRRVLVIPPKTVVGGWRRQIKRHFNIKYRVYRDPNALRDARMRAKINNTPDDTITFYIINYERAWRLSKLLKKVKWDMLIVDEAHRLKNPNSRQSKSMRNLARWIDNRLAMTGTPTEDDEIDLWPIMDLIMPGLLEDNWKTFQKRWCRKAGYMAKKRKLKKHLRKKFYNKISPYIYQISTREALPDLPPEQDLVIEFDLTGKAKKAYEELEDSFYTEIQGHEIMSPMSVTNMMKLSQLTGGFVNVDDDITIQLNQDKLNALLDWLHDLPKSEKLVIFCRWLPEIEILEKAIKRTGRTVMTYHGKTKDRDSWMRFQDRKDPNTIIAQIGAGGVGIELFAACYAVFYSRGWRRIDYDQGRHRLLRNGQARNVTFLHMVGRMTIDVDELNSLNKKGQTADDVAKQLKQRRSLMAKGEGGKGAGGKSGAKGGGNKGGKSGDAKGGKGAKGDSKEVVKKTRNKPTPPAMPTADYGVSYVAEALGVTTLTARQRLRDAGFKKDGRIYDFKTKKAADEIVKKLKDAAPKLKKGEGGKH